MSFKPPEVCKGQAVLFYPYGNFHESNSLVGYIQQTGSLCHDVIVAGQSYPAIRHVDDPAAQREDIRSNGLWSLIDSDRLLYERIEALEKRIDALEPSGASVKAAPTPKKNTPLSEMVK